MSTLCRPLVKRIGAELVPKQAQEVAVVKQSLAQLERAITPAILPLVMKNEIEHVQQLPRTFLHEQQSLSFVGYTCQELHSDFASATFLVPPVGCPTVLTGDSLVFLDEYHFVTLIRTLPTMFPNIRGNILFPYRGDYLPEVQLRQLLHQLGFPEIFVLDYDRLLDSYSISGVSNPVPVSSLPHMITPVAESDSTTRWLIANRIPAPT